MKALAIITVLTLFCLPSSHAGDFKDVIFSSNLDNITPGMESGYYVVIGAYAASKEHYAKLYTRKVNSMGYESSYGFSEKRNLFFVYLRYSQNYRESIAKMREARNIEEFKEAWVFVARGENVAVDESKAEETTEVMEKEVVGGLNEMYAEKFNTEKKQEEENPEKAITNEEETDSVEEKKEEVVVDNEVPLELEDSMEDTNEVDIADITIPAPEPKKIETLGDVSIFCNLFNARNHKDVKGEIQVVDAERAKLLKVIDGGDFVELEDPKNGTGKLLLICDVFGYRKSEQVINFYDPLPDTTKQHVNLIADVYAINFDLIRYHKGDIATMYNVYFFKDAALMRPESKFEVNNLLNMMKENPGYRIKIHGHVNGKHPGKIISKGDSDDYFALADGNVDGFGSAMLLSEKRAELIRDFLVLNGISEDRMEIKAWGGKRMIHDKHSTMAKHNVRVEIEILDE